MTRRHYDWRHGPADIEQHSIAKHNVLRAYLARYFETLAPSPHQDMMKLTLVDGFAGGGQYIHKDSRALVLGSPFVCLEAVRDAEASLNVDRRKPFKLDVEHFFVEKQPDACRFLEQTLRDQGYGDRLNRNVFVRQALFQDEAEGIVRSIRARSPRAGRAIFVLDQYGYSQVPGPLIKSIFRDLPGAEIVLTFGIDSFLNYANDGATTEATLRELGLGDLFGNRSIEQIRGSERHWRLFIQAVLYRGLIERCGAKHYTPFFIRSPQGHGDYWLIHMSQHPRARDVMTEVHWKNHNHFIHYGGAGLDMFQMMGYDPESDLCHTGQSRLGFEFDDVARRQSIAALREQFPRRLHQAPATFTELYESTCNSTPASQQLYREALGQLVQERELIIVGAEGEVRRSPNTIRGTDIVKPPPQRTLSFA